MHPYAVRNGLSRWSVWPRNKNNRKSPESSFYDTRHTINRGLGTLHSRWRDHILCILVLPAQEIRETQLYAEAALFFIGSHCCLLCQRRAVLFHVDKIFHPLEQHLRHIGHGLNTRDFLLLPRSGSTGSSFHAADMGFGGVSRVVCPYLRFLALQGD